jgi:hypothetical protein
MQDLDNEAWERWKAYRTAIKKPIKPASENAMKLKLARYGKDQAEVVDQSISNQWQGLFDLKKGLPQPGEKPVKSDKQVAVEQARLEADQSRSAKTWQEVSITPVGKLRLAEALWARYSVNTAPFGDDDRREWLKDKVGEIVRTMPPGDILGDPSLVSFIREVYGEKGVQRLKARTGGV